MRKGWNIKCLADIAVVKGGKRVPKGYKLESEPTEHPYITISDFTDDGTIDTSNLRYVDSAIFQQIKNYTISTKDLYLSIAGTIGRTGYVPPELDGASLTENACKLVLRPGIDRDFIYYFTKSEDFSRQAGINTRTAAQPKLALERLKTITLSVPESLAEQKRIVTLLDEAFAHIATAKANAEQNLQNARALFDSHLQSVFSQHGNDWSWKPLETISTILNGFAYKSTDFSPAVGAKCIKITNVGVRHFFCDSSSYLPANFINVLSAVTVRKGSIAMALTRSIIAGGLKVAVVPEEYDGALLNQRVASIETYADRLSSPFLFAYLSTDIAANYVKERVNTLMQPNLSIADLRAMPIPVPPLLLQKAITDQITLLQTETQRLESIYQQKLSALDALKKSLLHQTFSGQL